MRTRLCFHKLERPKSSKGNIIQERWICNSHTEHPPRERGKSWLPIRDCAPKCSYSQCSLDAVDVYIYRLFEKCCSLCDMWPHHREDGVGGYITAECYPNTSVYPAYFCCEHFHKIHDWVNVSRPSKKMDKVWRRDFTFDSATRGIKV